jgi:hypothetical protein
MALVFREKCWEFRIESSQFNIDMSSHVHARRIREDLGGVRSGVNGIPTRRANILN